MQIPSTVPSRGWLLIKNQFFFLFSFLVINFWLSCSPGAHSLSVFNHCYRWVLWFHPGRSYSWFLNGAWKRILFPTRGWLKALLGLFPLCLNQYLGHYWSRERWDKTHQCQKKNDQRSYCLDRVSYTCKASKHGQSNSTSFSLTRLYVVVVVVVLLFKASPGGKSEEGRVKTISCPPKSMHPSHSNRDVAGMWLPR